jgi:hypothetical protein
MRAALNIAGAGSVTPDMKAAEHLEFMRLWRLEVLYRSSCEGAGRTHGC